jgi:hypothetical protein
MEILFDIQPDPLAEVSLFGYIAVVVVAVARDRRRSPSLPRGISVNETQAQRGPELSQATAISSEASCGQPSLVLKAVAQLSDGRIDMVAAQGFLHLNLGYTRIDYSQASVSP